MMEYREEIIDAFRRRGIYPEEIDVVSESELAWHEPQIPTYSIPGLSVSELRFDLTPAVPLSALEIHRQAMALAMAIDADPRLYAELGLRDRTANGQPIDPPVIASLRPTVRIGPDGYFDVSVIAEITQEVCSEVGDGQVRHRGGAVLVLDASGKPSMVISQRMDNAQRLEQERAYARRAIRRGLLGLTDSTYEVRPETRRRLC